MLLAKDPQYDKINHIMSFPGEEEVMISAKIQLRDKSPAAVWTQPGGVVPGSGFDLHRPYCQRRTNSGIGLGLSGRCWHSQASLSAWAVDRLSACCIDNARACSSCDSFSTGSALA